MRKKSLIAIIFTTAVGVLIILVVNSVSATTPCNDLPKYTSQLEIYYENFEIYKDPCRPGFSFKTPNSYSKLGVSYYINQDFQNFRADTIEEYDSELRNIIAKLESCPDLPKYLRLATDEQLSKLSPDQFLTANQKSCKDIGSEIEHLANEKIINDFINSQSQFGDYATCKRSGYGSPSSFYVICDNRIKEEIRLVIESDKVVEAYFQNSYRESYRKIYPEDVLLRKRNPVWEREQYLHRIRVVAAGASITLLLVIGLIVFKKKKLFLKEK